jgi:hypothetical protein
LSENGFPTFQMSIMDGPLQVVVRHETAEGFIQGLEALAEMVPLIDTVGEKMVPPKNPPRDAEQMLVNGLNAQVVERTCPHGSMTYREGVSQSSGKPYKGWFCPMRGQNACKPIFA